MPQSGLPFDDIRALIPLLPAADTTARAALEGCRRAGQGGDFGKGNLGKLETYLAHMAAWQGRAEPRANRPLVAIFAGAHGFALQDQGKTAPEANRLTLARLSAGDQAVNQICKTFDLGLKVFDLAIEIPTADFTKGPALDEAGCAATIGFGMEAVANGTDLLCLGSVGQGGDVAAGAICAALLGGPVSGWLASQAAAGVSIAEAALGHHKGHLSDPLEILRRLGGRETAALVGAILAARMERVPVILDGMVACTAAAMVKALSSTGIDHCLAGHRGAGEAHAHLLAALGLEPIVDLALPGGEGTGAALAAGILKAGLAACHAGLPGDGGGGLAGNA